ncbi:MAG: FG-GAP repeat protein, partial [Planctomycetota bacterium]
MRGCSITPRLLVIMAGILSGPAGVTSRGQLCELHERQKLIASDASAYDDFGKSVSVSGEWSIVGAPGDNTSGTGSGSAYVFRRDDNRTPSDP